MNATDAANNLGRNISAPFQNVSTPGGSKMPSPMGGAVGVPLDGSVAATAVAVAVTNSVTGEVDYRNFSFQPLEPLHTMKKEVYIGPTPESNWVIPGILLVGAFPASTDDDDTFLQISEILKLGINKFVCLQQEYRETGVTEAMWRGGQGLRPYYEDVKNIVANKSKFDTFRNVKICDISQLTFVHFPIRDCGITDDAAVLKLCRQLVKCISEGEVLYLHCWGGHGRTGTVVCIMLHLMYALSSKDAMERCQIVHDMRQYPVEVGSPQTQSQRDQVTRVIKVLMSEMGLDPSPFSSTVVQNPNLIGKTMSVFAQTHTNIPGIENVTVFQSPMLSADSLQRCPTEILTGILDSQGLGGFSSEEVDMFFDSMQDVAPSTVFTSVGSSISGGGGGGGVGGSSSGDSDHSS